MDGTVTAVSRSDTHTFSKPTQHCIRLRTGLGVDGDLLGLPTGTRLHVGESAVVEVTGLRPLDKV